MAILEKLELVSSNLKVKMLFSIGLEGGIQVSSWLNWEIKVSDWLAVEIKSSDSPKRKIRVFYWTKSPIFLLP